MTITNTPSVEKLQRTIDKLEENLGIEQAHYKRASAKLDSLKETTWSTLVRKHLILEIKLIFEDFFSKALLAGAMMIVSTGIFLIGFVTADFIADVIVHLRRPAFGVFGRLFYPNKPFGFWVSIAYYRSYSIYAATAMVSLLTSIHITSLSSKIKLKDLI